MSNYHIKKIESIEVILKFWEHSPDATIFTHPNVLPSLVSKVEWWMALSGETQLCIWPICSPDFRNGGISKFVYYVGPFWGKIRLEMPIHRWLEMSRKVYRGFINEFINLGIFKESSLPLSLIDIREFIWFNKEGETSGNLEIIPRYTAVIRNLTLKTEEKILQDMKKVRRQDIRNVLNNNDLYVTNSIKHEELFELYKAHFEKRGYLIPENESDRLKSLSQLVNDGFGYFIGLREKQSDELVSAEVVLNCNKVANAITNLTRDDYRESGAGTAVIFFAICEAKNRGLDSFDFNGANSDSGAFFKHSLGAEPLLYFDLKAAIN